MISGRNKINSKKKSNLKLTPKQEKLVEALVTASPNETQNSIIQRAGYDPKNNHSSREIDNVIKKMEYIGDDRLKLLIKHIPEDKIFTVLSQAMDATKTVYIKDSNGDVIDNRLEPDWRTRLNAVGQARDSWELLRKTGEDKNDDIKIQIQILADSLGSRVIQ